MTELHETFAAKHSGVGRRIARVAARIGGSLICIVAAAALWASNASAQDAAADKAAPKLTSEMCLGCHGLEGFAPAVKPAPGSPPPVLKDRFLGSVHGKLNCVECHTNVTKIPHEKVEVKVSCVSCHESRLEDAKEKSKVAEIATLTRVIDMIGRYMKSIHAQPSKADQSHTNATCYNCHDAHYVYPKGTPNYNWWRLNLPYACGACHTSGARANTRPRCTGKEALLQGNPKAAICSDCHTTHDIQDPFLDKTQLLITKNCGSCHKEQLASYQGTYHGQVNTLGFTYTAKCFDCHGYHTIKRVNDPDIDRVSDQSPADLPEVPSRRDQGIPQLRAARQPRTISTRYPLHLARLEVHAAAAGRHLLVLLDAFGALVLPRIPRPPAEQEPAACARRSAQQRRRQAGRLLPALAGDLAHRASVLRHLHHHAGAHRHDAVLLRYDVGARSSAICSAARASPATCTASSRSALSASSSGTSPMCSCASGKQLEDLPLVRPRFDDPQLVGPRRRSSACSSGSSAWRRSRSSTAGPTGKSSTTGRRSGASPSSAAAAPCCGSRGSTATYLPGWVFNVATIFHGEEAVLGRRLPVHRALLQQSLAAGQIPARYPDVHRQDAARGIQARAHRRIQSPGRAGAIWINSWSTRRRGR